MRNSIVASVTLFCLLTCWMLPTASAQDSGANAWEAQFARAIPQSLQEDAEASGQGALESAQDTQPGGQDSRQNGQQAPDDQEAVVEGPGLTSDLQDPVVELKNIRQRRDTTPMRGDSLFRTSPLTPLREWSIDREKRIYEATNFKFGLSGNTLFQGLTDEIAGQRDFGMSSFFIYTGTWDGWRKGCPNQAEITISVEGRWNYGPPDPFTLGAAGLGSLGFTANPFTTYDPTYLVRNLFWRQGSREAGWMYRIGRVTPDQFLNTSQHISPLATYLPIVGTGGFTMGLPDSGFGMFAGKYVNDRVNIAGVVSDSNANRFTLGDLGQGDLFTAIELQAKIFPITKRAGYSKVTFWHNDGTADGNAINGSTGAEGWGVFLKYEQELTRDGRMIAIARWGRSYKDSALYDQQAAGHLVFYDPLGSGRFKRMGFNADVIGTAYNWVQPTGVDRDESNFELFYRFPLFPEMDATVSYQAIVNPALDPTNDYGSAFSLRLRSTW